NRGVPPEAQAAYLSRAMEMAWRMPDVRMMAQYLLRDIPVDASGAPGSRASVATFPTGVEFADGTPKAALTALAMPLGISPAAGGGWRAWGRVAPGDGARRVAFERAEADGAWRAGTPGVATRGDGTVERALAEPGTYRLRWEAPAGPRWSLPAVA